LIGYIGDIYHGVINLLMGVKGLCLFWRKSTTGSRTEDNIEKLGGRNLQKTTALTRTPASRRDRKITVISLSASRNKSNANENHNSSNHSNNNNNNTSNNNSNTKKLSNVRLQRVISEINEFQIRSEDHLKKDTTKKAKELLWFFSIFVVYVMFGVFLFFYIEECSGADKALDQSVLHEDIIEYPKYKNITQNCVNMYKGLIVSRGIRNITNISDVRLEDFSNETYNFDSFLGGCEEILRRAHKPVVIKKAKVTKCEVDEYELLKYAEFVIFTVLLIGKCKSIKYT